MILKHRTGLLLMLFLAGRLFAAGPLDKELREASHAIEGYRSEIQLLEKQLHAPRDGTTVLELARLLDSKELATLRLRNVENRKAVLEKQLFEKQYAAYLKVIAAEGIPEPVRQGAWIDLCKVWGVVPLAGERHLVWSDLENRVVSIRELGPGEPGARKVIGLNNGVVMAVQWCPPGRFLMGDAEGGLEASVHEVTLSRGFWMGATEVTRQQYHHLMGGEVEAEKAQLPMTDVSWHDANEFCERVSVAARLRCLLPTEAQWEYACRAGGTDDAVDAVAWYEGNVTNRAPQVVGTKRPNAWGLFDMQGNVREWCADSYDALFYLASPSVDPFNEQGAAKVIRGGCWFYDASFCRPGRRGSSVATGKNDHLGFRVIFY
jgi:hypothetical protein